MEQRADLLALLYLIKINESLDSSLAGAALNVGVVPIIMVNFLAHLVM